MVTLLLYLALLGTAYCLVLLGLGVLTNASSTSSLEFEWNRLATYVTTFVSVLAGLMTGYWIYVGCKTGVHRRKPERIWPRGEDPLKKIPVP